MKPKIAVIGAGYWGKNLIRNFYELGHLGAICDSNELLRLGFNKKYPEIPFLAHYEEILSDNSFDAVVLATSAAKHYAMAKKALAAGKHVYVEKPLALAVKEGEELIAMAGRASKVLMVGHILQYHSAILKLKELVKNGVLGKIQYLYSNRLNMGKIRTEENILWSFAPHDISVILMLLEEMPESISTSGGNYLQENIADATVTILSFPSGVKAHIFVSWLHPFKEQKLVVVGDRKMAVFDDTIDEKLLVYTHKIKWQNRVPIASKAEAEVIQTEMTEPLKSECEHFLSCIKNGKRPRTDGREGLRVLRVLNASQESLDKKGRIINIYNDLRPSIPQHGKQEPKAFVHESSYVDKDVKIGKGTNIWHFSHILTGSRIGRDCRIGQNVVIGPNVTIGDGCKIQNNVSVYEGVTLKEHVFCGPSVVFTNVFNPRCEIPRMKELQHTLVKKGATLGANCTVVCGNTIGSYAFVGAGAVITGDVPDYAIVVGNPAGITGWMCECGIKLRFEKQKTVCGACGSMYEKKGRSVVVKGVGRDD